MFLVNVKNIEIMLSMAKINSYTRRMKRGSFINHALKIRPHELESINFLLDRGFNIELIIPSNTPKNKNPDFLMNGIE